MKILYLVRHAKSSWDEPDLSDFERPLNKRGDHDALILGKFLKDKNIRPDIILSSPAKRALSTAKIFANIVNYQINKIITDEKIYEATSRHLMTSIRNINEENKIAMLFGHNPSLTNFTNLLGSEYISSLPTCAVVGLELGVKKWSAVDRHCGKTFLFEYPKKLK